MNIWTCLQRSERSHTAIDDDNVCLSGLKEVIVAPSFFLYYEYHQSIRVLLKTAEFQYENISKIKDSSA